MPRDHVSVIVTIRMLRHMTAVPASTGERTAFRGEIADIASPERAGGLDGLGAQRAAVSAVVVGRACAERGRASHQISMFAAA
jgi:hypothetical protein